MVVCFCVPDWLQALMKRQKTEKNRTITRMILKKIYFGRPEPAHSRQGSRFFPWFCGESINSVVKRCGVWGNSFDAGGGYVVDLSFTFIFIGSSHAKFSAHYFEGITAAFLVAGFRLLVRRLAVLFLPAFFANLGCDFGTSFVSLYWAITALNAWRYSADKAIGPTFRSTPIGSFNSALQSNFQLLVLAIFF